MTGSDTEGLVRLPFDHYQRYAFAARIAAALRDGGPPLRILEVGANFHRDLERFLPEERIVYLDLARATNGACRDALVQGDGAANPFADGAFDLVLALDVLEHLPPARRQSFLSEGRRVARRALVVCAPCDDPELVATEVRLNAYFRELHGYDYPWLAEHRAHGLPDLDELLRLVERLGWPTAVWGVGNLGLWARLMQAHFYVNSEPELVSLRADVDELYNRELWARDASPPVYRRFVVAATAADLDRLGPLGRVPEGVCERDVARLQERLDRLYETGEQRRHRRARDELASEREARRREAAEHARALAEVESRARRLEAALRGMERLEETLVARDAAVMRLSHALHAQEQAALGDARHIEELGREVERETQATAAMRATLSWRLTMPLRKVMPVFRFLRLLFRSRLHRMELQPVHHLVVEDDRLRSTGDDPQLLLQSSRGRLPTAWVVVSYQVESPEQWLDPKLYVDAGTGFSEERTIKLPVAASGVVEHLIRLPDRVRALRLDPLAAPGRFALRDVTFREIGSARAAVALSWTHLRSILLRPWNVRRLTRRVRAGRAGALEQRVLAVDQETADYRQWVAAYDLLTEADRASIRDHIGRLRSRPLVSVVMATFDTPERWLVRAIESVRAQLYPHWELCIADDASAAPHVRRLLEEYRARDPRIKVTSRLTRGHIAAATNGALELATGEWAAFLDHDDELAEHALYLLAAEIDGHPDAEFIYSDEDKIDAEGRRYDPYFKPDWDPDLHRTQNFAAHLCAYRRRLVLEVGGLRSEYDGAQDWDLALRISERIPASHVRHLPYVLYHWRAVTGSTALAGDQKSYASEAQRRALAAHFERLGQPVRIAPSGAYWRVSHALPDPAPLVTIIIPTRDRVDLLRRCVESILAKTSYPSFELLIVDNQSLERETFRYFDLLRARHGARTVRYDAPFNYSAMNNLGARHARGEVLALLNNDVEVISPGWLAEMVSHALRPEIGAVGAMLYYPNGTIQHAGVILGLGGVAAHAYQHRARGHAGQMSRATLTQTVSAVTGACLVLRRRLYEELGGLDETHVAVAYNDVDLCLRVREKGLRNLWTPHAELYHHESASRGADKGPVKGTRFSREMAYMVHMWRAVLERDPAYNPNLALDRDAFSFAFPPRVVKPWVAAEAARHVEPEAETQAVLLPVTAPSAG